MMTIIFIGIAAIFAVMYLVDVIDRHNKDSYLYREIEQFEKFQRAFQGEDK